MHYVGPDQLNGFETRTTTDIYPADFGWAPDYHKPGERSDWWYHNLGSVTAAGVVEISNQMEYDDELAHSGAPTPYQLGRHEDERQCCSTVSPPTRMTPMWHTAVVRIHMQIVMI